MILTSKKSIVAALAAIAFVAAPGTSISEAAPKDEPKPTVEEQINVDEYAKAVAEQYDVNEEQVKAALKAQRPLDDIDYAAMLAKVSGKSFQQVLNMKADWFDVMQQLGITFEKYKSTVRDLEAADIAKRSGLEKATVLKLLDEHYFPRDIRIAGRLAKAAGKDVREVLGMKKINYHWFDVADELKVSRDLVRPKGPADEAEDKEAEKSN